MSSFCIKCEDKTNTYLFLTDFNSKTNLYCNPQASLVLRRPHRFLLYTFMFVALWLDACFTTGVTTAILLVLRNGNGMSKASFLPLLQFPLCSCFSLVLVSSNEDN